MMRRLIALTMAAAFTTAARGIHFGDLSHKVVYENATDGSVSIFPYGRDYPDMKLVLQPGATQNANLLIRDEKSDTLVATIEAVDQSGTFIFCRRYTNADLKDTADRVIGKKRRVQMLMVEPEGNQ